MQSMTFFLGVLGLLQMLLLPGLIGLYGIKLSMPWMRRIALAVPISMVINYIMVLLLVLAHWYVPGVMIGLLVVEAIILIMLVPKLRQPLAWPQASHRLTALWQSCVQSSFVSMRVVVLGAAVLVSFLYLASILSQFGGVFQSWGATILVNGWATDLLGNHLPSSTLGIPQLLSANLSIPYVWQSMLVSGEPLQMFPQAALLMLPAVVIFSVWDLALTFRQVRYLMMLPLVTALLYTIFANGDISALGMVVAIFVWASIYLVLLIQAAQQYKDETILGCAERYVEIAMLLVAGAAVIQKSGIVLAVVFPFIAIHMLWKGRYSNVAVLRKAFTSWLVTLIIAGPWYLYRHQLVVTNQAPSVPWFSMNFGPEISSVHSIIQPLDHLGILFWACMTLGLISSFRAGASRWVFWLLVVPYLGLYLGFFRDSMNSIGWMLPLLAYNSAMGLVLCVKKLANHSYSIAMMKGLRKLSLLHWCLVAICASLMVNFLPKLRLGTLAQKQQWQIQHAVYPEFIQKLYDYDQHVGIHGKVLTNWDYLQTLPGLREHYMAYQPFGEIASSRVSALMLSDLPTYSPKFKEANYLLVETRSQLISDRNLQYIELAVARGKLKCLIQQPGIVLYQIMQDQRWPLYTIIPPPKQTVSS